MNWIKQQYFICTSDLITKLTAQGSKRCGNPRAHLWTLSHTICSQTSRDSTMDRTSKERLEMGSYDINLCRDSGLLPHVRQRAYRHGASYLQQRCVRPFNTEYERGYFI